MGIHDRDYYRESTRGWADGFGGNKVTVWLIGITCGVFFGQCLTGHPLRSDLVALGRYDPSAIADGEVWRLLTPVFLHTGLWHLVMNMFVLYWVGSRMEEKYGGGEFLAFYLLAGVTANLLYFLSQEAGLQPNASAVGASGAVNAALVLYALHYPRQQVLLFFVIPMPVWVLVVAFITLDALGTFGAVNQQVAYAVHLGGALFGFLYYQSGRRITAIFTRSPNRAKRRRAPALRLVPAEPAELSAPLPVTNEPPAQPADPTEEPFEVKVDRVLAKVSALGQESLTSEEREILFRAGEVYKNRRK
ncbi:MAG TPA: rhomboid family intramembrane serine protease [Gemmataceae bacterium]|nr:rhomboid family intramembrane serine protease [Gemmataceae bacterium]